MGFFLKQIRSTLNLEIDVVAFGGGTNSAAMIVGLVGRGIRPKEIVFADTGGEKPHTYAFVDTFSAWLAECGYPAITVVSKKYTMPDVTFKETLEEECLRKGIIPGVAFGFKSCTQKHKQQPQHDYLKRLAWVQQRWEAGLPVCRAIGFDVGESRRVRPSGDPKYSNVFPLVEWGWDREKCVEVITSAGLPLPGKSSCFFCPNASKDEYSWLYENEPELYQRALKMEREAWQVNSETIGLGPRRTKLAMFVPAGSYDVEEPNVEQACECFDG